MQKILPHLRAKRVLYGGLAIVLLFAWFLLSGSKDKKEESFTLTKGSFIEEVNVSGKVIAARDVDLGFSQSGRVAHVYATVGGSVQAGAILAELENGDLRASVSQRQAALERERASLAALQEGTRPEEVEIARSEVEQDQVVLGQARDALIEAAQNAFTTSDDAIRNVLDQFINEPRTNPQITFIVNDAQLENKVENARRGMENTLTDWQERATTLSDSGLTAVVPIVQANLTKVTSILADANAALNKAIPTGSVTQTNLDSYKTSVASVRSSVNTAISSLTSAITAERNAVSSLETSQKSLALKEAGTRGSDLTAQEADVKAAEADLSSAQANLEKTIMRAPFTGIVSKMDLKVGSIASANTSEVSLISSGKFQIETFIPEVNIALISVGDKAKITLDAYGSDTSFDAAVVSIDPAETVHEGVSTYKTTLQFTKTDDRIRSGMTANTKIITEEIPETLSIPKVATYEREGTWYVQVKNGKKTEEREVTTGATSLGLVEITKGLSEGAIVVLPSKQ